MEGDGKQYTVAWNFKLHVSGVTSELRTHSMPFLITGLSGMVTHPFFGQEKA